MHSNICHRTRNIQKHKKPMDLRLPKACCSNQMTTPTYNTCGNHWLILTNQTQHIPAYKTLNHPFLTTVENKDPPLPPPLSSPPQTATATPTSFSPRPRHTMESTAASIATYHIRALEKDLPHAIGFRQRRLGKEVCEIYSVGAVRSV